MSKHSLPSSEVYSVPSLQFKWFESLFLSIIALPRAYDLLSQGQGLLLKRKFPIWHLLSSTYFRKIGIIKTLESYSAKGSSADEGSWLASEDKDPSNSSRRSSATNTLLSALQRNYHSCRSFSGGGFSFYSV